MVEKKLNIAMLSVHSSPFGELGTNDTGGMSVCIREMARELGELGHSVDIFTRQTNPENGKILDLQDNVRLIYLRAGHCGHMPKLDIYNILPDLCGAFERFCRQEGIGYDLLHSHYWLSAKVGEYAQRRWSLTHFITFHTLGAVKNQIEGVEKEPELRVINERQLANTCHRVVASTETEREHLKTYYGVPPHSVGVIPCGVNLDLFRPLDKRASRRGLGLHQDESLLLYVGRFVPSKGADRMLEVMRHLQGNRMFRLLIVGGDDHDTPEAKSLRELSRQHGLQDRVTFLGRVPQEKLPAYYSAADLLVVPSRYESFGLVALESLACGTPVVATRVGAMERILREGETGHLVMNGVSKPFCRGNRGLCIKFTWPFGRCDQGLRDHGSLGRM